MNDVSGVADHDVTVMSIFDLEEPGDNTVTCHALDEVLPGVLEPWRVLVSVCLRRKVMSEEVIKQVLTLKSMSCTVRIKYGSLQRWNTMENCKIIQMSTLIK